MGFPIFWCGCCNSRFITTVDSWQELIRDKTATRQDSNAITWTRSFRYNKTDTWHARCFSILLGPPWQDRIRDQKTALQDSTEYCTTYPNHILLWLAHYLSVERCNHGRKPMMRSKQRRTTSVENKLPTYQKRLEEDFFGCGRSQHCKSEQW